MNVLSVVIGFALITKYTYTVLLDVEHDTTGELAIMENLRTGNIVLFSGRCTISKLIRLLSWSKWSHVGMIINDDPQYPFPLLYESTHNDTIKGLDVGDYTQGVQIVPFLDRLMTYNGSIGLRRVISPCYNQRHQLRLYRTKMIGVPFEKNILEVLASAELFRWLRKDENLSSVFCSEHHAEATMALGWLNRDKPSNHYSPKFFAKNNDYLNGVSFGKIEILKR